MKTVEVFRTNVLQQRQASLLIRELLRHFPSYSISIDLDDCDKVLRVEGHAVSVGKVVEIVCAGGYRCEPLD